ncbi:hypothetical protein J6590_097614 [Homalodisca vitripennis]|nr:hypothetical protein J6590_097614 [Homalodisca vitripennis]
MFKRGPITQSGLGRMTYAAACSGFIGTAQLNVRNLSVLDGSVSQLLHSASCDHPVLLLREELVNELGDSEVCDLITPSRPRSITDGRRHSHFGWRSVMKNKNKLLVFFSIKSLVFVEFLCLEKCRGKTRKYNKATHQLNGRRDSAITLVLWDYTDHTSRAASQHTNPNNKTHPQKQNQPLRRTLAFWVADGKTRKYNKATHQLNGRETLQQHNPHPKQNNQTKHKQTKQNKNTPYNPKPSRYLLDRSTLTSV